MIEQFFVGAAPESGLSPKPTGPTGRAYRVGKVPRNLLPVGDRQEAKFGRLGREYGKIAFDKAVLPTDPTLEWVTPGHPLFEAVRTDLLARVGDHLLRGAVFYDLHRDRPAVLDLFAASIKDGRGHTLHRRLFAVETPAAGTMSLQEPTILHDIPPAPPGTPPDLRGFTPPARQQVERFLYELALTPWAEAGSADRVREVERVERYVEISLNALIDRQQVQLGDYLNRQVAGQTVAGLDGLIAQAEQHLDELNTRRDERKRELELERHCTIADITHVGRAAVLPHPDRATPQLAPMVRDDEIERTAVAAATRHEQARGWVVESVEAENRGFDLISRKPHPADPRTFTEVRSIEVKGRAGVGVVALSENEYRTAQRLKGDYWLYAVFNCAATPELYTIPDPARLGWKPVMTVEHYQIGPGEIRSAEGKHPT